MLQGQAEQEELRMPALQPGTIQTLPLLKQEPTIQIRFGKNSSTYLLKSHSGFRYPSEDYFFDFFQLPLKERFVITGHST